MAPITTAEQCIRAQKKVIGHYIFQESTRQRNKIFSHPVIQERHISFFLPHRYFVHQFVNSICDQYYRVQKITEESDIGVNQDIPGILVTIARAFSARFRFKWAPLPALYLFSSCTGQKPFPVIR